MTTLKRLLLVAYYFPPHATVGALRPRGFCRYLKEYGWMPWVVSTDADSVCPPCPSDEGLLRTLPPDVVAERIPYVSRNDKVLLLRDRLRRMARRQPATCEAGLRAAQSSATQRCSSFKRFLMDYFLDFPDPQNSWFRPVMRHLKQVPIASRPHVVMATGSPWTSLLIGHEIARRWKVPFIADLRDPWASDAVHGYASDWLNKRSEQLEAMVCANAAAIIANTEELKAQLAEKHPLDAHKIVTITNGYNLDVPQLPRQTSALSEMTTRLELCHFGNIYGERNALSLLQAVDDLRREYRLNSDRFLLRFVGSWEPRDGASIEVAKALQQENLFRTEPPIPHDDCLKEMAGADVLLILQPHSAARIPAKTYEYIASGRPILLIGEEGSASRLIERHRLGRCCPNSVSAIKELLGSILENKNTLIPPPQEEVRRFDYKVLTQQLAAVLDSAMGRGKSSRS